MNITELVKAAHDNAVNKGFYSDGDKNIGELLMLIASELGETIEAHRNNRYFYKKIPGVIKPAAEEWRPVKNYETEYMVSNYGNVKSNNIKAWNGKVFYEKPVKLLKPGLSKTGYMTVALRGKTFKVAWLVAEAFLGDRKNKVVNHINGNKKCDWVTNLEYVTYSENNLHAIKTGLSNRERTLSHSDKVNISFRFKNKESANSIHKDYKNVSLSAIKNIRQQGIKKYTDCVEFELADAVIRIADMCGYLGIDLEKHIELKMKYNATREYKHGKRY